MTIQPFPDGAAPLAQCETQLQMLIDGVLDYAIYLLDREGCVASWNSGANRIKGYEREEILGRHFEHFYTAEDQLKGEPARNLSLAAEIGRAEAEGWRVRKDGSRFWAHVIIDRITDDKGTLVGFAKITRDVTEQRNARRDLDTAREALFQTQKGEALGKLTGGVAHDFNNLLMAVQGALDLMKVRYPDDSHMDSLIRLAMASVTRGANLTRKMLGFARRQALHPVAMNPSVVIHGMMELLNATAGPRIDVSTQVLPHLPPIYVDPQEIELALINLTANARDALPHGGHIVLAADESEIPVAEARGRSGGRYVCLSVTDDGEGMHRDVLARATEPFFSTREVGRGVGMGLSTVEGFAEQSGGWLALHSEPGTGTRAEIWLPAMGSLVGDRAPATPRPDAAIRPSDPLRILLVDDDPLVLQTVAALLEDLGHIVTTAQRGQQALDLLVSGAACDVLLSDYAMPGMTGTMLADSARALRPNLAIILATGYADADSERFTGVGRLSKPFDRRALASALSHAIAT